MENEKLRKVILMIPSLDTYLYKEFEQRLKIILSECYIIDEALKDIDTEALESFKNTYCSIDGKPPKKEIEISYSFPQEKQGFNTRYVITLGGSEEEQKSVGGIQGSYAYREGDIIKEDVTLVRNNNEIIMNTTKPVAEFLGSQDLSFSASDHFKLKNNKPTFDYSGNEHLVGETYSVIYSSKETDEDVSGVYKGYLSSDTVNIVGISTNMDTARCLDAIARLILITMRDSLDEKTGYMLQTLQFGDMQPVIESGDMLVFGRPCTIGYKVTNSISFDLNRRIREVIIKRRMKE